MSGSVNVSKLLRQSAVSPELAWFCVLLLLAAVSGARLEDDSYGHFARSLTQVHSLDFFTWITDVWNKPLPGLAFGLGSCAGLFGARAVACAFTVGTAYFTARLVEHLLPDVKLPRSALLLFFFSQQAVLKDAFSTMTELPAAFFLAAALVLWVVYQRPAWSGFLAGWIPLCRVEMVPVVAVLGASMALAILTLPPATTATQAAPERLRPRLLRATGALALMGLPMLTWLVIGALLSNDLHWFGRASYAQLRTHWDLAGLLQHNVLVRLVYVAPPTLLLLFCHGLCVGFRSRDKSPLLLGLLAILGVHYAILNCLVVYPEDWFGAPAGHAIAAINARNYSSSAPVFIALTLWLSASWHQRAASTDPSTAKCFTRDMAAAAGFVALLLCVAFWRRWSDLALHLGVLVASSLLLLRWAKAELAQPGVFWRRAALLSFVGVLIVRPFFWYPVPATDQREAALRALASELNQQRPSVAVQDLASALDVAAAGWGEPLATTSAPWTWPGAFADQLSKAPPNAWLVLEVDRNGNAMGRYPAEVIAEVRSGRLSEIARFERPRIAPVQGFLDALSARNAPISWRAYRKRF